MEPATFKTLSRRMVGANWIVRAERAGLQSVGEMVLEIARLLNETAKRPLGIRTSRVEEDAKLSGGGVRINPLTT